MTFDQGTLYSEIFNFKMSCEPYWTSKVILAKQLGANSQIEEEST